MIPVELTESKKKYSGFELNFSSDDILYRNLLEFKKYSGYIWNNEALEEWHFSGIMHKQKTYIYGPSFKGVSLAEVLNLPPEKALKYIFRLSSALNDIETRKNVVLQISMDSVFFLKNDGVLFLPVKVIDILREAADEKIRLENHLLINHPYISDNKHNQSYSIAVLLYRIFTGDFPFYGETEEELGNKIRMGTIIPPRLKNTEIKKEISDEIVLFFNEKKWEHITASDWANTIDGYLKEGIAREIGDAERKELAQELNKFQNKYENSYKMKTFIEHNKNVIIIISSVICLLLLLTYGFRKVIFDIRMTKGYTAEKVVDLFYTGMNTLDSTAMSDCVEDKAGRKEIDEVTTLFVLTRQNMAYGKKENYISATDWDARGRKKLEPPMYVYGVTGIKIVPEDQNPTNSIFSAVYQKWEPVFKEQEKLDVNYRGFNVSDKVFLRKKHNYWIIYKIDRLEKTPL